MLSVRTKVILASLFFVTSTDVYSAHIGAKKIVRIRNVSPTFVVVWLDTDINNAPACATVKRKIVFDGMDFDWGKAKFSMLMAAYMAGHRIDPNCTNTCRSNYDGQLTICREMSIQP